MRDGDIGVLVCTESPAQLILMELDIDLNRPLCRLILDGLRGIDAAIGVHGIAKEGDIIQQRIALVVCGVLFRTVEGVHVRVVVVAVGCRRDLRDDKACVIRDGTCMLQRCRHGDVHIAVGVLCLLSVAVLHIQGGIARKLRVVIGAVFLYLIGISVTGLHAPYGRDVYLFVVLSDIGRFEGVLFHLLPALILCHLQLFREALLQGNLVLSLCKRNRNALLIRINRIPEGIDIFCRESRGGMILVIGKDNGGIPADGDHTVRGLRLRDLRLFRYDISRNGLFLNLIVFPDTDGIGSLFICRLDLAEDLRDLDTVQRDPAIERIPVNVRCLLRKAALFQRKPCISHDHRVIALCRSGNRCRLVLDLESVLFLFDLCVQFFFCRQIREIAIRCFFCGFLRRPGGLFRCRPGGFLNRCLGCRFRQCPGTALRRSLCCTFRGSLRALRTYGLFRCAAFTRRRLCRLFACLFRGSRR